MKILGLNVFHADTSACIIVDGELIAAVEEERFTRIKHFTGFPKNSIDFCLSQSNLILEDIDTKEAIKKLLERPLKEEY